MGLYSKQIEEIERLHRVYLDLRENTPEFQRDGEECKAYRAWYEMAYVFFSGVKELHESPDYTIFRKARKTGNCFVLELLKETNYITQEQFDNMIKDAKEIMHMLTASIVTARKRARK